MEPAEAEKALEALKRKIDKSLDDIKRIARELDGVLEELKRAEERLKTYK